MNWSVFFAAGADNCFYSKCGGCNEDIRDKYLLQALDKLWHVYCLRCCDCRETLDEGKCFFRDGNILCKMDFFRWVIISIIKGLAYSAAHWILNWSEGNFSLFCRTFYGFYRVHIFGISVWRRYSNRSSLMMDFHKLFNAPNKTEDLSSRALTSIDFPLYNIVHTSGVFLQRSPP